MSEQSRRNGWQYAPRNDCPSLDLVDEGTRESELNHGNPRGTRGNANMRICMMLEQPLLRASLAALFTLHVPVVVIIRGNDRSIGRKMPRSAEGCKNTSGESKRLTISGSFPFRARRGERGLNRSVVFCARGSNRGRQLAA